jgi:hypothetical protein
MEDYLKELGDLPFDINEDESDSIDFKETWHKNKAELLHDILCFANSLSQKKYKRLIVGLTDKKPRAVNPNLKPLFNNESELHDWLRNIKINNGIRISMHKWGSIEELRIANQEKRKPYFLYEDYFDGQKRVKAGAVYTRNGSSNTPIDKTAKDYEVENLWKQRFGLNIKDPLERLKFELKKISNFHKDSIEAHWSCTYDDGGQSFFNRLEPSLAITFESLSSETIYEENIDAKWGALEYPCSAAKFWDITVKWNETKVQKFDFVEVDSSPGHGKYLPVPMKMLDQDNNVVDFCIISSSIEFYLLKIFLNRFNQNVHVPKLVQLFHSLDEAQGYATSQNLRFWNNEDEYLEEIEQ